MGRILLMPLSERLGLAVKVVAIMICLSAMYGGNHPPAYAQQRGQIIPVPVITAEDAVQDSDIAALNKHIESTDANSARNWQATQKNAADIAGMQGEERGIGAVLVFLASTGIVLQIKSRAKAA